MTVIFRISPEVTPLVGFSLTQVSLLMGRSKTNLRVLKVTSRIKRVSDNDKTDLLLFDVEDTFEWAKTACRYDAIKGLTGRRPRFSLIEAHFRLNSENDCECPKCGAFAIGSTGKIWCRSCGVTGRVVVPLEW